MLGQRILEAILAPGMKLVVGRSEIQIVPDTEELASGAVNEGESFRGLVGSSPSIRRLFTTLARLDGSLVAILVRGESGVGKELVARAIHEGSLVGRGPFVPVNCGALARELVASTLFGHTRGAFTGADKARNGAFMAADGGTLFLDEIGELPIDVQPMLLRALESSEVQVLGEDTPRKVRVRILAATNRDLRAAVASGRFREDLYYRLAVVPLEVPPLRERLDDIPTLASHFARQEGLPGLPDDVLAHLATLPWPGNIRELRNAIQAYAALGVVPERGGRSPGVLDAALAAFLQDDAPYAEQKEQLAERFTRLYVEAVLRKSPNQKEAAKVAGLDRTYFGRLVAKYGLKSDG